MPRAPRSPVAGDWPAGTAQHLGAFARRGCRTVFGPVVSVTPFDTADEAIARANRCETGLAGYVSTRDLALGLRVAERLEVGMVGLNRGVVSDPAAPFGGVKESGLGREGGHEGLLEYTETTMIAVRW
ncbi:aldehyde dehydrogenase family protein [Streptomyces sp. AD55]|uniref:aldehyde dehydrogenase family protein n=1 Tax=Streptomyces sp. AD55 TaxID=3242895 RepID=UPI003527F5E6